MAAGEALGKGVITVDLDDAEHQFATPAMRKLALRNVSAGWIWGNGMGRACTRRGRERITFFRFRNQAEKLVLP